MHPLLKLFAAIALIDWIFTPEEPPMASIQKDFEDFHAKIKLDEDDENAKLREKRDTLLSELRDKLPDDVPKFKEFHQGSYSMNTGVVPLDGNFDIDVGLVFDCEKDKYPDPVALKKKVRDALTREKRSVGIRRPCVTVTYLKDGSPEFHVDLAIYVKRSDDCLDIAMGRESSAAELKVWEKSSPKQLTELINKKFSGDDAAQFRRCVRYLKRWRDKNFSSGAPLSIALTVAAYKWFAPNQELSGKYSDLKALKALTTNILCNFSYRFHEGTLFDRLAVELPVTPNKDLMEGMTNLQMQAFKVRLTSLKDELTAAEKDVLPEDACKRMNKQFGDEFLVPATTNTAKSVRSPYISTGTSA